MEVNRKITSSLLFAAVVGMAGVAQGLDGFVSTDDPAMETPTENQAIAPESADGNAYSNPGYSSGDVYYNPMAYDTMGYAPMPYEASYGSAPAGIGGMFGLDINGYVNAGGQFNNHGANYNMTSMNSDNQLGLDGAYLSIAKHARTGAGAIDWGFGTDVMFGRDAWYFAGYTGLDSDWNLGHRSSNYNDNPLLRRDLTDEERESYGFAMPQLYGEASISNWSVKIGHFYSLMGYESSRADQRFFYGMSRNFEVTPTTHTGALVTFTGIENMEWSVGWAAGENNTFDRGYNESLVIGGVKYALADQTLVKYAFVVGDGAMSDRKGDLFRNDVVLSQKFGGCWEAAFLFNYGSFDSENTGRFNGDYSFYGGVTDLAQVYGNVKYQTWATYLYYTLNPCWKIGNRVEWQRATTASFRGPREGLETFNFGFGANWTPMGNEHFVVRPEIRYDMAKLPIDRYAGAFGNNFSAKDQLTLGVDLLCKF